MTLGNILGKRTGPIAACTVILLGGALAFIAMPDDTSPRGALFLPAVILAISMLFVPFLRVVFAPKEALRPESFVAFGIVYWLLLDLIQEAYPLYGVSPDAVRDALILVAVYAMSMWIGTLGRPWALPHFITSASERPLEISLVWKLIFLCFLLGMAPYVIATNFNVVEMFSYLGEERWVAPWSRGQLGGWDAFLDQLQYFGFLLPSLAVFLATRKGWLRLEVWLAISLAVIVLLFLSQAGGRRIVGVTIGAAIICWLLTRKTLKVRTILGVGLAAGSLLMIMQFMLEIRSQGYDSYITYGRQYEYLHVDDNIFRLSQVVEIVPASHPYIYLKQIYFILIRPIPRVFWEGKPIDAGFDLPSIVGIEGTSLSTSIIGEWYLVSGFFTVMLGGWFHGRLAAAVGALIEGEKSAIINPIVYSISVMVLVAGLRSMQDLVIMSYAVLAWYGVTWLIPRRSVVFRRTT